MVVHNQTPNKWINNYTQKDATERNRRDKGEIVHFSSLKLNKC